jgi:hypothetical protein
MPVVDKNRPSPEWIAELRRRFPVEREIDRILTRKLTLRSGPGFEPQTLGCVVTRYDKRPLRPQRAIL